MIIPRAKKTGRWTSCAASRICCVGSDAFAAPLAEMADDVLDHDDGAVDHHAEVERAQREQVGGDAAQVEADGGEEQGERHGERDNDSAAHVAEEEERG
jgi:hypothetical protein